MSSAYNVILIICLVISIVISLNGRASPHIRALVFLMIVTATVELGSDYHIFPAVKGYQNHWLYNFSTVFEIYFFSYFFYQVLKDSLSRKLIKIFVFFYPIILIVSFLTIQKWYIFHTYTFIAGLLYLNILCLLYFRQLYTAIEFKKLSTLPEFWIVTGLLVFTVGVLPYFILLNYLNTNHIMVSEFYRDYILTTINIMMYTMFSIGLLLSIWTKK